jgi:hypothetical protein
MHTLRGRTAEDEWLLDKSLAPPYIARVVPNTRVTIRGPGGENDCQKQIASLDSLMSFTKFAPSYTVFARTSPSVA